MATLAPLWRFNVQALQSEFSKLPLEIRSRIIGRAVEHNGNLKWEEFKFAASDGIFVMECMSVFYHKFVPFTIAYAVVGGTDGAA